MSFEWFKGVKVTFLEFVLFSVMYYADDCAALVNTWIFFT